MARLTIPDEQTFAEFTVVTSTSVFPISFSLFAKADLTVIVDGSAISQSAFSFAGTVLDGGGYDGGTVTLNTAVDDVTVRIERNVAPARTSNFAPASTTPTQSVDQAFNRVIAGLQDLERKKLTVPSGAPAGKFMAFDANGNPVFASGTGADTALRTDLAAGTGAALVKYTPDVLAGVARTIKEKMDEVVSVLDFPGATGEAKLQAALDSGAVEIYIPPEGIEVDDEVPYTGAGPLRIYGPGEIDLADDGHLKLGGGITALPYLAADIVPSSGLVTFLSAHGLAVGDAFMVENDTPGSFHSSRTYYRDGQTFHVVAVPSSTTVRIGSRARRTFTAGLMNCFKLNTRGVDLTGLVVKPPSTALVAITVDGVAGVRADGMTIKNGTPNTALVINRCYDFSVNDLRSEAHGSGDRYPIVIASSQKGVIRAGTGLYSSRHAVALGGNTQEGSVPVADLFISGIFETDPAEGFGATDMHGNCENITYHDSQIYHSAALSGRNNSYVNCTITGWSRSAFSGASLGTCVYGSEMGGGVMELKDCTFVSDGGAFYGLLFDLTIEDTLTEDLRIIITNPRLKYEGSAIGSAELVRIVTGNDSAVWTSSKRVDVIIDNPIWPVGLAAPRTVLRNTGTVDISALMSLTVRGARNLPAGTLLFAADSTANDDVPVYHDLTLKGTTANRPANPHQGQRYYDTTLVAVTGKPIEWNGTAWIDADGATA